MWRAVSSICEYRIWQREEHVSLKRNPSPFTSVELMGEVFFVEAMFSIAKAMFGIDETS